MRTGSRPGSPKATGFTYIGLLVAVAVVGIGLAATGELASQASQREKERELLFAGGELRRAIAAYYERSPGGAKRYPKTLEELLLDRRHSATERHLRRLYRDPMTGRQEWGLVEAPGGGIMGVHSLSETAPVKTANFAPPDAAFERAPSYKEWKFVYQPAGPASDKDQQRTK